MWKNLVYCPSWLPSTNPPSLYQWGKIKTDNSLLILKGPEGVLWNAVFTLSRSYLCGQGHHNEKEGRKGKAMRKSHFPSVESDARGAGVTKVPLDNVAWEVNLHCR